MIIRGTTPKLLFTVNSDIDLNLLDELWITISVQLKSSSKKTKTYDKNTKGVTIDPAHKQIELLLSQEDTLSFNASTCQVQLRIRMQDGMCYASEIYEEEIGPVLNAGVI